MRHAMSSARLMEPRTATGDGAGMSWVTLRRSVCAVSTVVAVVASGCSDPETVGLQFGPTRNTVGVSADGALVSLHGPLGARPVIDDKTGKSIATSQFAR